MRMFFLNLRAIIMKTQQFLPYKRIINARDLGGCVVQDGRRVREGFLLRMAHLADATDADIQHLAELPVTKVVDFRREEEKRGKEDRMIPGAQYVALPVDASKNAMEQASEKEKKRFTRGKKFELKKIILLLAFNARAQAAVQEMYMTLFFAPECQLQYARFMRLVLDTEEGAVLFHCTQGKDRTGVASALLLAALGADRKTIVDDYDVTNFVYARDVRKYSRRVKFLGGKEKELAVVKALLGAHTENFVKALDAVDRQYGSLDAYLKGPMGLSDEDIQTLRRRYLDGHEMSFC